MSDPLFTLRSHGVMRGDCTASYLVDFHYNTPHPTVKEFVDYVIHNLNKEWGYIAIAPDKNHLTVWQIIGVPSDVRIQLDYRWGKIADDRHDILLKLGSRRIISATADGGWSRMDYVLLLEEYSVEFLTTMNEIKTARESVESLYFHGILNDNEYNHIMTEIDGAESRRKDVKKVFKDD